MEGNNLCWRGVSLLGRGFFQVGGMGKFLDSGGDSPIPPKQRKSCTMQFNSTGYESNLLFFSCVWLGKKNACHSILITSDYLSYNKYVVLAFMTGLFDHLNHIRKSVFCDGAPTQFKQKFTMC